MKSITPAVFGLAHHKMQQFHASLPIGTEPEDLESPDTWVNVASMTRPGDLIWVDGEDHSFTALVKVTYSAGTRIRVKVVFFSRLDVVDAEKEQDDNEPYFIKLMGIKKWCIIERTTAAIKIEMIPTKLEAHKALDEYLRALAS